MSDVPMLQDNTDCRGLQLSVRRGQVAPPRKV